MRLIDADALADALFDQRRNYPQWVANTIGGMPDAVVRCKDCKHHGTMDCPMCEEADCPFMTADNWYCADGERQEGR